MGAAFNCGIQEERPHVERDEQVPELWRPKEQILKLTCHVVPKGTRPHMVKLRPGEELHDFHVTRKLRTGDTEEFIDRFGVMHSFEFPMWAKKGDVLKIKITVPVVAEAGEAAIFTTRRALLERRSNQFLRTNSRRIPASTGGRQPSLLLRWPHHRLHLTKIQDDTSHVP